MADLVGIYILLVFVQKKRGPLAQRLRGGSI